VKWRITTSEPEAPPRFRERLQTELGERCSRNPNYSLRAFALDLATDHSTLSQLLRGKRRMTEASIRALGGQLGLDEEELDAWVDAERTPKVPPATRSLDADTAALAPAWPHDALLELLAIEGFRPDARWIAATLGISVDEVGLALHQLLRLGLLEMAAADRWEDLLGDARARGDVEPPPPAHRLEGATLTAVVDRRRLGELRARIRAWCAELGSELEQHTTRDALVRIDLNLALLTSGAAAGDPDEEETWDDPSPVGRS